MISIPVPSTTQPGDVLVAVIDIQYRPAITAPAGWQFVRSDVSSSGNHLEQAVYTHDAGTSEPASYAWAFSSSHGAVGGVIDYVGIDPVSPVEASAAAFTTNRLAVVAPSLTTTATGAVQLAVFGVQGDHMATLPGSLGAEYAIAMNGLVGEKLSALAGDRTISSVGATGNVSASFSQSSTGIGASIALRPATSSGGTNQPPVVDAVTVSPASPVTNDVLQAVVTAHDPDGDPLTFSHQWVLNGVDLAGATRATLDLSQAGNGDRGDQLAVRVTANDGQAASVPVTSPQVTVADSPPTATVGLNTIAPTATSTLTASVHVADADGDSVMLTYVWTVNGVAVQTTTTSALSDDLDLSTACSCSGGDRVDVYVTPNDGTLDGAPATTSAVVGLLSSFGSVSSFPLAAMGIPGNIATGPDGNIWFTEENLPDVGRIDVTSGAITLFSVPSNMTGLAGIVTGPDNNVWFVDPKALEVARLVPSTGQVTEFNTSVAGVGIVSGSDGNLWMTASASNRILVISTAGNVLHTYVVPTANGFPHGPTLGRDGNIYFAELKASKLARITPMGTFTEWKLPHTGSKPFVTAFGPDGLLYATENAGNRIARLNPSSGTIAEFTVPTAKSAPAGIAAGSDGNVWFAELNANKLARITAGGAITEFPLPTPSQGPDKLVGGSDGNLWFAEHSAHAIGQFSLHCNQHPNERGRGVSGIVRPPVKPHGRLPRLLGACLLGLVLWQPPASSEA